MLKQVWSEPLERQDRQQVALVGQGEQEAHQQPEVEDHHLSYEVAAGNNHDYNAFIHANRLFLRGTKHLYRPEEGVREGKGI